MQINPSIGLVEPYTSIERVVDSPLTHSSPTFLPPQYADRAKAIQLKAKKNEQLTEVGKLKKEIDELRALLAAAHATGGTGAGGFGGGVDPEAEARMRRDMEELQAMQQSSFEEKERIAREMEKVRAFPTPFFGWMCRFSGWARRAARIVGPRMGKRGAGMQLEEHMARDGAGEGMDG
jgi:hypothetical protein